MDDLPSILEGAEYTMQPRYCTIYHPVRQKLELSINEYVIIDGISHLSNTPNHPWCSQSKEEMADFTGLSRATVYRAIETGADKGLLERNNRGDLRATDLWIEEVQLYKARTTKKYPKK